jgi:hypothetical protein
MMRTPHRSRGAFACLARAVLAATAALAVLSLPPALAHAGADSRSVDDSAPAPAPPQPPPERPKAPTGGEDRILTSIPEATPLAGEALPLPHHVAARAEWAPYVESERKGGVCLIDTGVTSNPDTAPITLTREAIEGGTPDDVYPEWGHGTEMAMDIAAPRNGWGTVGLYPGLVRIYSVRAMRPGSAGLMFSDYEKALQLCLRWGVDGAVHVVNMSFGGDRRPPAAELARIEDRIAELRRLGIAVVAAAGNGGPTRSVDFPAKHPPILGVGAMDRDGGYCWISSRGSGLDLLAPGCGVRTAHYLTGAPVASSGSSVASAIVAGTIASIAANAGLSGVRAEELVRTTAERGRLDVRDAFTRAGLGDLVAQGELGRKADDPALPGPAPSEAAPSIGTLWTPGVDAFPNTGTITDARTPRRRLATPRIAGVRIRGRKVVIRLRQRPWRARAEISLWVPGSSDFSRRRVAHIRTARSRIALVCPSRPRELTVRYSDARRVLADSLIRRVNLRRK